MAKESIIQEFKLKVIDKTKNFLTATGLKPITT